MWPRKFDFHSRMAVAWRAPVYAHGVAGVEQQGDPNLHELSLSSMPQFYCCSCVSTHVVAEVALLLIAQTKSTNDSPILLQSGCFSWGFQGCGCPKGAPLITGKALASVQDRHRLKLKIWCESIILKILMLLCRYYRPYPAISSVLLFSFFP